MRHQDPRITTEVYGHLSGHYLKKEMERLSFGAAPPEPGDDVAGTGRAIGMRRTRNVAEPSTNQRGSRDAST
jgi:hypothetical protein